MRAPAGWYPDPQDRSRLRLWDGALWTDRVVAAGAAGPPPSRRGGTARVVAAVAGVALVLGVGVGLGLRTLGQPDAPVTDDPTTPVADPVYPREPVEVTFEEGETWDEPITITSTGVYRVVAEGGGSSDLRLELTQDGTSLASNDDGRSPLRGASSLDPLLVVVLHPGDYELVVGTYRDRAAGSGTLQVEHLTGAVPLTPGETAELDVPSDGAVVGFLTREDAASVVVDVRADGDADLAMLVTDAEGGTRYVQDRGGSAADTHGGERGDPLTTTTATDVVVVVWTIDGVAAGATLALSPG